MYERDKIASQGDARLLFNMADHYSSCGAEQKEVFLDIVEDLLDRSTKFQGIHIPDDQKSANHILMDRKFGILSIWGELNIFFPIFFFAPQIAQARRYG